MRDYESVFILSPDASEEDRNKVLDRIKETIEASGSITTLDEWGNRKLAYEINDHTEGYYVLANFKAETSVIDEIARICRITDIIIRNMVIRQD